MNNLSLIRLVAAYLFYVSPLVNAQLEAANNSSKGTVEINYFPVYERICEYGHPILITGWSLDEATRFIHFKNPDYQKNKDEQEPYFYLALNNDQRRITTEMQYNDLDYHKKGPIYSEDLVKLTSIPIISAVSGREIDIVNVFGKWDYRHNRKTGYKVIYVKPFCFKKTLLLGFSYEMKDGLIINARGIKTKEKLIAAVHDYRTFTGAIGSSQFNNAVHHYADEPQLKNGPVDRLLHFILFKELGSVNQASFLLDYKLDDNPEYFSQTEPEIEIDSNTLTYQVIDHGEGWVRIAINYSLKNGRSVKQIYEMLLIEKKWRVVPLVESDN